MGKHMFFEMVFCGSLGFTKESKKAKIAEIKECAAGFGVYKGLVVIMRKGCKRFGELRLIIIIIICDLDKEFRWYIVKSGSFKGFFEKCEERLDS